MSFIARTGRIGRPAAVAALVLGATTTIVSVARGAVAAPVITEPEYEGQMISPFDVHMVAGPFVGSPGEQHVCSDWELVDVASLQTIWSATCVTGTLDVHIHLGDGTFEGSLAGAHELVPYKDYRLRVRFDGDALPGGDWSPWSERNFHTQAATVVEPLVVSDISVVPPPRWFDAAGKDVALPPPARGEAASLVVGVPGLGELLRFGGLDGLSNLVENPPALGGHGQVRIDVAAATVSLSIPPTTLTFTDGSGADRVIALPAIALDPGHAASYWISAIGEAFTPAAGAPADTPPTMAESNRVTAATVPWNVLVPGFRVDRIVTGFRLPVEIAFVPTPPADDAAPYFYVSELYGSIEVVSRSGAVSTYATGLLDFDPLGSFPGSGEKGLAGIVVDPASGDLFAGTLEAQPGITDYHFPKVVRLHSTDGGRTSSSTTTIVDFPHEPLGPSHQISNVSIGSDGKLYVHIGDGLFVPTPAQDMTSVRGKILRLNFDGTPPADNPFFTAHSGAPVAADYIFALGLRNPFGGTWRAADGAQWEVENGPSVDRLAKVVAGRNYLYDGSDASMANFAAYNWPVSVAPVNIAFVQSSTFGGSGFPAEHQDHAFVTESGPTWAAGPQIFGKRVSEFSFDADGKLLSGPLPLIQYAGAGRGTAVALAAGPDGLYFSDLYEDFGSTSGADPGASVFRIRYVGVVDFSASKASGRVPVDVQFADASDVPGATAWHWDFGDGGTSDEQSPLHTYAFPGTYDVRLTVTGPAGPASRQKGAFIVVASPPRDLECCELPPPTRPVRPR